MSSYRGRRRVAAAAVLASILAPAIATSIEAASPRSGGLHVHGVAIDPGDSSKLFAALHDGLFLISADGNGVGISANPDDYAGFVIDAKNPDVIFASGHSAAGGNLGLIASRDGGRNWVAMSPGANGTADFHALAVSAAAPKILYGLDEDVQISRDGGETWEVAGSTPSPAIDLAVSAIDPGIVYAATADGMVLSLDEGRTWRPTAGDRGAPATMVQTAPDGSIYAFVVGSGLIKTPATGLDWSPVATDFIDGVISHLAIDSADPDRMFAVTQHSRFLVSTDGGLGWIPLTATAKSVNGVDPY